MDGIDGRARREREESAGVRTRLRRRLGRLFSPRAFAVAVVATAVGLVAGGAVPLVGTLTGYLGVFAAGFALGLAGWRRYAEVGLAGAAAAGVSALLDHLVLSLAGVGAPVVAVGAGTGLLAALGGHYFGRDLRGGLTRDL